jgi:hypothetical protein
MQLRYEDNVVRSEGGMAAQRSSHIAVIIIIIIIIITLCYSIWLAHYYGMVHAL